MWGAPALHGYKNDGAYVSDYEFKRKIMKRYAFILSILAFTPSQVLATTKPETAWLIYPSKKESPAVEIWRAKTKANEFVWRLLSHDGRIIAKMKEPHTPKAYAFNYGQCRVNGILRDDILAIVKHNESIEWSLDVQDAWLADPKAEAFIRVPAKGIECLNEGYGT